MERVEHHDITSRSRQQIWTLDQIGNWDIGQLAADDDANLLARDCVRVRCVRSFAQGEEHDNASACRGI